MGYRTVISHLYQRLLCWFRYDQYNQKIQIVNQ